MIRRTALLVVVTAIAAACGGNEEPESSSSSASPSTAAVTSASTAAPSSTTITEYEMPVDELDILLADEDVAQFGLEGGGFFDPDAGEQSVCGVGVVSDVPGWDGGNLPYNNADGTLHMEETVWAWADTASAEAAFDLLVEDLSCGSGTVTDAEGVKLAFELEEAPLETEGSEAFLVAGTVGARGLRINVILAHVRFENYLLQFSFTAPTETAEAPDATEIVAVATTKLLAVIG